MDIGQPNENQLLKYLSKRFGIHCEDCGRANYLTVHHRIPRRSNGTMMPEIWRYCAFGVTGREKELIDPKGLTVKNFKM